ncbi:MAG: hypothetical protein NTW21_18045 [Verrucomicrobia bacterium]|nr:hypothetical protein [Verrucomicrobiota bacterium]
MKKTVRIFPLRVPRIQAAGLIGVDGFHSMSAGSPSMAADVSACRTRHEKVANNFPGPGVSGDRFAGDHAFPARKHGYERVAHRESIHAD